MSQTSRVDLARPELPGSSPSPIVDWMLFCSLADQRSFELRDGAKDVPEKNTLRRGHVDGIANGLKWALRSSESSITCSR